MPQKTTNATVTPLTHTMPANTWIEATEESWLTADQRWSRNTADTGRAIDPQITAVRAARRDHESRGASSGCGTAISSTTLVTRQKAKKPPKPMAVPVMNNNGLSQP